MGASVIPPSGSDRPGPLEVTRRNGDRTETLKVHLGQKALMMPTWDGKGEVVQFSSEQAALQAIEELPKGKEDFAVIRHDSPQGTYYTVGVLAGDLSTRDHYTSMKQQGKAEASIEFVVVRDADGSTALFGVEPNAESK